MAVLLPAVALQYHAYFRFCEPAPDAVRAFASSTIDVQLPLAVAHPMRPWCAPAAASGSAMSLPALAQTAVAATSLRARLAAAWRLLVSAPPLYAFVQREYWGVGPWQYYRLKHIPQFLLAAPALITAVAAVLHFVRRAPGARGAVAQVAAALGSALCIRAVISPAESKVGAPRRSGRNAEQRVASGWAAPHVLPYLLHWLLLTATAAVAMHVNVVTRFVAAACPALYWFLADAWLRAASPTAAAARVDAVDQALRSARLASYAPSPHGALMLVLDARFWMLGWCVGFTLAGGLLFPNFLPWT
jgi:hypothetical protein